LKHFIKNFKKINAGIFWKFWQDLIANPNGVFVIEMF
jgi:hypothetical protein